MKLSSGGSGIHPFGCSALAVDESRINVFFKSDAEFISAAANCGAGAVRLIGSSSSLVNVSISLTEATSQAKITLTGPSDVWFGVGINAHAMADQPWTIVVEGEANSTTVTERHLGNHNPGSVLPPSLKVLSIDVDHEHKTRTIMVSRDLQGKDSRYYTFDLKAIMETNGALPFINAIGSSPTISYHKAHAIGASDDCET